MSRQRSYLVTEGRRLRNDRPIYQASDSEIQFDLKKMKYMKKSDPIIPTETQIKIELPKKRKAPVNEEKYIIDGLVKLMNSKGPEAVKSPPEPEKKLPETAAKPFYQNQALATYLVLQSQFLRNNLYMSQFQCLPFQNPTPITSSADKHLRAAQFIQSHKALMKVPMQK